MPPHLETPDWWAHARRVVRDGGLVVANVAVMPQAPAAARDAHAARDAFGAVSAVGEHAVLKRKRRGNVVLVATAQPQGELAAALGRYAASAPLPTGVAANWL